jgi:NAD(P) transhydrogenase subunit alpha
MKIQIAVPRELRARESRVALVPAAIANLVEEGFAVNIEHGSGLRSHTDDGTYAANGATVFSDRMELLASADLVLTVRGLGSDDVKSFSRDVSAMKRGAALVGLLEPHENQDRFRALTEHGILAFALELMPRITRAQSMDVLSSMSTIAGYRSVLLAAEASPRMFPLMMTAAGTLTATRVFVLGAGVAGLQAIATARRLGAIVQAYDVRPAVREQVESLGATFVSFEVAQAAESSEGYAVAQAEDFYDRQREQLAGTLRETDVAITTALVAGRRAPILITAEAVAGMRRGSVIVDLAAERGGNCALSHPGKTVTQHDVSILAPLDITSAAAVHASQMYARNTSNFVKHIASPDGLRVNPDDKIVSSTLVTGVNQQPNAPPVKAEAS